MWWPTRRQASSLAWPGLAMVAPGLPGKARWRAGSRQLELGGLLEVGGRSIGA